MTSRRIYCKTLGITLPRGFDVHHIDLNRLNNDILNLVALPTILHRKYHMSAIMNYPEGCLTVGKIPPNQWIAPGNGDFIGQLITDLKEFRPLYYAIQSWIMYRDHLMNDRIPNFHELNYNYDEAFL